MKEKQPDLHMPGWPEMRFQDVATHDGSIWWWSDGSIKRHPLQPYNYTVFETETEPNQKF